MKAIEEIKNGKGYITFTDLTGKYASFIREVNETDPVKLKKLAKNEEARVTGLYDVYEMTTKHLLNKPIDLTKGRTKLVI